MRNDVVGTTTTRRAYVVLVFLAVLVNLDPRFICESLSFQAL